ncbi:S-layer homology domain-containing protein [Paenibacillus athensensis]|uniref:SLH domain-containing protein n=1 Tax=Paenibacillus athensensis TaxID=1967502 RepID=A0A4Y8Q6L0_9BACL|nr:S-layer homology domain-containing protein [Paenibacillus athensensis]MCD1259733.1 S-layer homology domain-containing protein [Paenibacillus athensensis]
MNKRKIAAAALAAGLLGVVGSELPAFLPTVPAVAASAPSVALNKGETVDANGVITPQAPPDIGLTPQEALRPRPEAAMDTTVSSWARQDVAWMIGKGLVPEVLEGDYRTNITREQYARLVYNTINYFVRKIKGDNYWFILPRDNRFTDADTPYINTAYALGIVNGVTDSEFQPDQAITREQAAVMMANMLGAISQPGLSTADYGFVDRLSIAGWALDSVNICGNASIFSGTDQGFRPSDHYTREQAIVTVKRLIDAAGDSVSSLRIRHQFEIPISRLIGGISVGGDYFNVIAPDNDDDGTYAELIEGLRGPLSAATVERLKAGAPSETLQDGPYTITPLKGDYLFRVSWRSAT